MRERIYFFLKLILLLSASIGTPLSAEDLPDHKETTATEREWPFTPEEIPADPDRFMGEFIHMMLMLISVLIAMVALAWTLRRFLHSRLQQVNVTSDIKITERRSLGPRSALYLVEVDSCKLLIGESPSGLVRLGQLEAHKDKAASSFEHILDEKMSEEQ